MLHWTIEARHPDCTHGEPFELQGVPHSTLHVPQQRNVIALGISFDDLATKLQRHPAVYWEPDGSFAWTEQGPPRHRIQGQLTDGGERLQYVELWGVASSSMLDALLEWISAPPTGLMFQLMQAGVFVDETTIREILALHANDVA